jgi:pSer/pThr/pTyr-binding forkhead associated (FHA) protein
MFQDVPEEIEAPDTELEPEAPELPELAPLPKDQRFSLAVIAGSQAGSVFPITKPRVYLGRGSTMDVQVKDSEVSRRHAMLEVRKGKVVLIDMGATNGTWVGGERAEEAEITNQGEFTLGSTTLMLIITGGAGA